MKKQTKKPDQGALTPPKPQWEKEVYRACFTAEQGADFVLFIRQQIADAERRGYEKARLEAFKLTEECEIEKHRGRCNLDQCRLYHKK